DIHKNLPRVHFASLTSPKSLSTRVGRSQHAHGETAKIFQGVPSVRLRAVPALVVLLGVAAFSSSTCRAQLGNSAVLEVDNWRKAVLAGDSTILKSMYADNPRIFAPGQTPSNVKSAVDYWTSWKTRGLKALSVEINGQHEPQPGFHVLVIQLTLTVSENGATKKYYVKMGQGYV